MLCEHFPLATSLGETITLDAYCPQPFSGDARIAVIICPGGGYEHLSDRESEPVALRFAAMGMNAFVVHYRVGHYRFPSQMQDVAAAVAFVRTHARRLHTDPERIAVMGFSAGGHAAGSLGVFWPESDLFSPLGLSPLDVEPNALVLCYPVITAGPHANRGTFCNLTGTDDPAIHAHYSLEKLVNSAVPPTFLWSTWTDGAVPCENTLLMAGALKENGIPAEVHIFPHGHHGLALATPLTSGGDPDKIEPDCAVWPDMAARFLRRVLK